MALSRRGFVQRVGAGVVALTLARHLPGIAPKPLDVTPKPPAVNGGLTIGDTVTFNLEGDVEPHGTYPDKTLTGMTYVVTSVSGSDITYEPLRHIYADTK